MIELHWELTPNSGTYSLTVQWDNGISQTMHKIERPFLLYENGQPTHAFFALIEDIPEANARSKATRNICIPLRQD